MLATASLAVAASLGASYRTANFIVEAPSPALAEEIGKAAEQYRHDLAIEWLGSAMPNWSRPCPIRAEVAPAITEATAGCDASHDTDSASMV